VPDAVDRCLPILPAFFGKNGSANNTLYRRLGIKQRSNQEMRADDITRARELVEGELKLTLPEAAEAA
jgi:ring-1,2-phenylacetyl-CoA epoxidase subunit PaaA